MKQTLSKYYKNNNIILLDRAFIGLYALFVNIKKITNKKKIMFTSTTCPSPVFASILAGLKPVFTDIGLDDYLMDINQAKKMIKEDKEIAAIVYIYTFGHISQDVLIMRELAKSNNIIFIEDVAQALGAKINGSEAGSIGDAAVLSFGYSKQINHGCGGALMINSHIFNKCDLVREIKDIKRYENNPSLATQYRDEFYTIRKAALSDSTKYLLYNQFPFIYNALYFKEIEVDWMVVKHKFEYFIKDNHRNKRNLKAHIYQDSLLESPIKHNLILPTLSMNYSVYRYTFMTKEKKDAQMLSHYLRNNKIECSNLYVPVSRIYNNDGYHNAVYLAERVINLWVDDTVDEEHIKDTIKYMNQFYLNKR